jgi:hypothetical protein
MIAWKREPSATKTDFALAKAHLKTNINATNTYE